MQRLAQCSRKGVTSRVESLFIDNSKSKPMIYGIVDSISDPQCLIR